MNLKLPHWAQLTLALTIVIVTWTVQQTQAGNLVLPATVISVLTLVSTVLGILSSSAVPLNNARAVAMFAAKQAPGGGNDSPRGPNAPL
jgi:hypothetical protein